MSVKYPIPFLAEGIKPGSPMVIAFVMQMSVV